MGNAGEYSLPVLPRVGERIALSPNDGNKMYRVATEALAQLVNGARQIRIPGKDQAAAIPPPSSY